MACVSGQATATETWSEEALWLVKREEERVAATVVVV